MTDNNPDPIQAAIDALQWAKRRILALSAAGSDADWNHDTEYSEPKISAEIAQLRQFQRDKIVIDRAEVDADGLKKAVDAMKECFHGVILVDAGPTMDCTDAGITHASHIESAARTVSRAVAKRMEG